MSLSTLVPIDWDAEDAGRDIVNDLRRTGFCVIRNHPMQDWKQTIDLRSRWREWFEDSRVKESYRHDYTQAGWFGRHHAETAVGRTRRDAKEYFQIFGHTTAQIPAGIRIDTREHFKAMNSFAVEVAARIDANHDHGSDLNLHKAITDSPATMLRVAYYPKLDDIDKPSDEWAGAHTDVNLFTMIPCNAEAGLQLLNSNDEWEYVPWHSTYLVVNVGDMLQSMSDGYFKSAKHRVVTAHGGVGLDQSRLSLPFFVHPRPEVDVGGITAGDFLDRRLEELGVRNVSENG